MCECDIVNKMNLTTNMNWKLSALWIFFIILGLSSLVKAAQKNPLKDPRICGRPQCDPETNKFQYMSRKHYNYDLVMEIRSEFFGTGKNISELVLKASVELTFPRNCEGVLNLASVKLEKKQPIDETSDEMPEEVDYYFDIGPTPKEENVHPKSIEVAKDLQKYRLRFDFHDGIISEICPNAEEPIWVLNFKKGILSSLQNTMYRFDVDLNTTESDVSGTCNVVYTLLGAEGTSVLIQKVKNIETCRNRHKMHSVLQTTPYSFRDDKSIWPILNSKSYCNLTVDHNIYKDVVCFERHQLIPFSNNKTGAVTESMIKLSLHSEVDRKNDDYYDYDSDNLIQTRSTLLFDHTPSVKPTHGEIKNSRDLLKKMCKLGFPNIQREFIDAFTQFLQTTRLLTYKALHQLLARSGSICENGKNHVLESLPYIGSSAAVKLMRDQMVEGSIPKETAHNWMTTLSFLPRPDEETLETFFTLLEYGQKKVDPEYTLGATAVVHSFCRHHPDCESNKKVQLIVKHLQDEFLKLIGTSKKERRVRERLAVVLKGLGNIGIITEDFSDILKRVIKDEKLPMDIRLQAVVAFRRVDCLKHREYFLNVYQNFTENSEIRILSYLQAMRCPDYFSMQTVKYVLETEEISQVGSYVWSHLTNLAKSASPARVEAQGLLLNNDLGTKFKMDIRKFSRNFEHSIFFDEYNFGTSTDANIIFGTDSYLPRMATLNFTADLFGESINFFEISARMQGFEQLITSIFGPKGPLNAEMFKEKFKLLSTIMGEGSVELDDAILNFDKLRLKRDSHDEDDDYNFEEEDETLPRPTRAAVDRKADISNSIDKLGYKLKYNYNDPRADIGLRIFGNDLRYYTIEGMLEVMAIADKFNPLKQLANILLGNELKFSKSGVFLDASYNIPMSSGLPLSIHAFGASSIDIRLSGKLDYVDQKPGSWNFDLEGKLKPSVSVDVITTMESDFFYTSSGIRVKSNLYSSSSTEAKLKSRNNKLISLTFSLPQDQNEIFGARSELLVIDDDQEIPQPGIPRRYENSTCTWPVLDQMIGLRICSQYSVPDVSNATTNYPGLILSGPINLSVQLQKVDKTAKTFVFEYRWNQTDNTSAGSFVFETPGTVVPRILTTNYTRDAETLNATMSLVHGNMSYSAVGKYSSNPDDRKLDIYVDSNGKKHLALEMNINRTLAKNGYVYYPRLLLIINEERIAGLAGSVKVVDKSGVTQSDVDLTFETKRLQARCVGYFSRTEISYSTKLKMDYRFQSKKVETIEFDGELSNKSQKSKIEYRSTAKLQTTAYPSLGFQANAIFLSLLGHAEIKLIHNNAPDFVDPKYSTTIRVIMARSEPDDPKFEGYRTRLSFEISRPITNIDFRILLKHEERFKKGPVHNFFAAIRYAPKKEATAVFSLFFPRRVLFAVDAAMNITIPSFDSCTARLILIEKNPNDYSIDFNGAWFSGHSIEVKGTYSDKSTRIRAHHTLKLVVKSPSFKDTTINFIYRRNEAELFADLQAEYDKDPYGLSFKYYATDEDQRNTFIELKVKEKIYFVSVKMRSKVPKQLLIEIHLDKVRDIHLKIQGLSTERKKKALIEVKWDANRDPSQRLALLAEFNNPQHKKYDATFMVTYPERTFSCGFDIYTGGPEYHGTARASWSTNEAIVLIYDLGFSPGELSNGWVNVDLTTPFEGWRQNGLHGGVYYENNLLLANASMLWAESQSIGVVFKGDYETKDPLFRCEVKLGINSTIPDVPTMSASFNHKYDLRRVVTDIDVRYSLHAEALQVYSIKSDWNLNQDSFFKNVSGSVLFKSPFKGYTTGAFATKLRLSSNRDILGGATLNFEDRKFTLALKGYVRKLTDNMFQVNITTPIDKFRTITGRLGLSERKRHAVAEIRAPAGALGVEVLLDINNFSDFDVKFNLATPIEVFSRISLIGKIKPETIDIRGGLNNVTLGFTGVWRMSNVTDFEYSYLVFTPLEKFEENGAVIKLVKSKEFILEFFGKFAAYKAGIKVYLEPKPKIITQLSGKGIGAQIFPDEDLLLAAGGSSESSESTSSDEEVAGLEYEDDMEDEFELLNYIGYVELDTLVWPTIKGTVDIEEVEDYYNVIGDLHLPQGKVDIVNRLYYPDMLTINNVLKIMTPFPAFKEIKGKFQYSIEFKKHYIAGLEFSFKNPYETTEVGYFANYTITTDETEAKVHDVALVLKTPFKVLKKIHVTGFLELEETSYRANFTSKTAETQLSLGGALESDDNFLDGSIGILLETPIIPHYACRIYFKKDFSEIENTIDMGFDVFDNGTSNKLRIESMWKIDQTHYINARGRIHTNILPLKLAETSILLTKNPYPQAAFNLSLLDTKGNRTDFRASATRRKDHVAVEVATPYQDFRNITLQGVLSKSTKANEHLISGNLYRNTDAYHVDGVIRISSEVPVDVKLRLRPKTGKADGVVNFSLTKTEGDYGTTFQFSAIEDGKMCTIAGGYSLRSRLDWDFSILLQSSLHEISRISLNAGLVPESGGKIHGKVDLETPWRHLGIESVKLETNLNIRHETGKIDTNYQLGVLKGHGTCSWSWVLLENMQLSVETFIERSGSSPRIVQAYARYVNPNKSFQKFAVGGKLNVDSLWTLEANGSLNYISTNDFSAGLSTQLPKPFGDIHRLSGRYRGNIMTSDPLDFTIDGKYESDEAKNRYAGRVHYMNVNDLKGSCRIEWGRDPKKELAEGSVQMLKKGPNRKEFSARAMTPFYQNEDSFFVLGSYDIQELYHLFTCSVKYPSSRQVADTDLKISSLSNMRGHINSTVPFLNITWLRGDFDFTTDGGDSLRYLKATWPADSAIFKLKSTYTSHDLNRDLQGTLNVEIPLATRHRADVQYDLKDRQLVTVGHATVNLNGEKVLNGEYNSKSEQRAGFEKDVVDISLGNKFKPLGIHYIHSRQYVNTEQPDYDMKHVEIFELAKSASFNITGELHVKSTETGQDYKIIAIHPNRTVILNSDYDYLDTLTKLRSKIQLSPTAWVGYSFQLDNKTTHDNESQSFSVEFSYPKRNLSAEGWYWLTDKNMDSDISFKWTNPDKKNINKKLIRAGLQWSSEILQTNEKDHQTVRITIGHPSFEKDIELNGVYYKNPIELLNARVILNYSTDEKHLVEFNAVLKDLTTIVGYRNYTLNVFGHHNKSNLLLDVKGTAAARPSLYKAVSKALYKRSFFPDRHAVFLAFLDLDGREIDYLRTTPYKSVKFWVQPYGSYPLYGINGTIWDSPDLNSTGYFYIDLDDKYTRMEVNLTPDATQNIQMVGVIPDARSGYLDLWRNYDEIRVIDIGSYLRMNHSRLVTGQFHWRPKMKSEIKEKIRSIGSTFYDSLSEGIDFWIRTVYTETSESLNDIWDSAKPVTTELLNDINGLSVLETDLEDFRIFVNQSYEANDFYIKTVVNYTLTILDELAIRDHIESLPKIFSEIWQSLGDSGKALRKSILWLIETIKTTYHNALETISKFLHGESLEHLSNIMQNAVEKYDKFIKDVHISFIKYFENMYNQLATSVSNYWKSILRRIEPHIFRFMHYIESAIWNITKEVFDFIYKRTNEIAESPYFNQVSSFTQDLDRLYKDIQKNDAITNFKKYSAIAWEFVKEKYFKWVPFGEELNEILTELWTEIKNLQKLDHVQFILDKLNDIKSNIEWVAEEIELEKRLHQLWNLIKNKITTSTQNALQTDNMYREAKTKFIFDPEAGIIDLEQKLPMSWHAFNETPKFEEIPEYKMINDVQNLFADSNFSLFGYLYHMKSNLDYRTWLPPYKSRSLLIGSRHYMTFDKRFVNLNVKYELLSSGKGSNQCVYLLAHDFFNKNFTLLLEPSIVTKANKTISSRKFTLVTDKDVIEIDVSGDTIKIGKNIAPLLPIKLGDAVISREADILTIESQQEFVLNCNLQFDLCWFEVGGWYFGQTAGILGTMNNEEFDDFTTSRGQISLNEIGFINSWGLNNCRQGPVQPVKEYPANLVELCSEFFKTAYFSSCIGSLDPTPFYDMCLDMGINSMSATSQDNYPIQKGACTAALGYIEACVALKIPMRVPDQCVYCTFPNGSYVPEGAFIEYKEKDIPRTTDVVFIIEAKTCNKDFTSIKNIMTVATAVETELEASNITQNRYAVVVFGGRSPFDKARAIVHHNKVFTDSSNLKTYFDHIETNNGTNNDIFQALSTATKLLFRPAASKTFILIPCSACVQKEMKFDYSSMLQLLLEEGINLHILMDPDFEFDKQRLTRIFFGLDQEFAYSKRDLKEFKGDSELRKQVRLPSSALGVCGPLAIETKGSIFTTRKLRPEKRNPIKRFASIFAKRLAKTAAPESCQTCECSGHNTGISYMECTSCDVPNPTNVDYDFDENNPDWSTWDWMDEDEEDITDM